MEDITDHSWTMTKLQHSALACYELAIQIVSWRLRKTSDCSPRMERSQNWDEQNEKSGRTSESQLTSNLKIEQEKSASLGELPREEMEKWAKGSNQALVTWNFQLQQWWAWLRLTPSRSLARARPRRLSTVWLSIYSFCCRCSGWNFRSSNSGWGPLFVLEIWG